MKRFIILMILLSVLFLSSCSFFRAEDVILTDGQKAYIDKIVLCDSKVSDYKINGIVQLVAFFNNGKIGTGHHEFGYTYKKDGIEHVREITLFKYFINDQEYYTADFNKITLPFSECRDLKSVTKSF